MTVEPTIPDNAPTDAGVLDEALDSVQRMRLEWGTTRPEMAAERLEEARLQFREAMKLLDTREDRDLHFRVGNFVNGLDDFCAVLRERGRS